MTPKVATTQSGFTLVELMITLVLGALVLTLAVPSFRTLVQSNQMTTVLNDLVTDLSLARSEAIKNGGGATACKRNAAGSACDTTADWHDGWIVFSDIDGDGTIDAGDGDAILRIHEPLISDFNVANARNRISYDSRGATTAFSGTFVICDDRGASEARALILSATGRLRRGQDSNADGTEEDGSGNEVTCP